MKKLLFSSILGLAALGLSAAPSQAWTFGLIPHHCWPCSCFGCGCDKCCGTVCIRPYNAFSPVASGSMCFDGCNPFCCGGYSGGYRRLRRLPRRHDAAWLRQHPGGAGPAPAAVQPTPAPAANPGPGAQALPYGGPVQAAGALRQRLRLRQRPHDGGAQRRPALLRRLRSLRVLRNPCHETASGRRGGHFVRPAGPTPFGAWRPSSSLAFQLLDDLGDERRIVLARR